VQVLGHHLLPAQLGGALDGGVAVARQVGEQGVGASFGPTSNRLMCWVRPGVREAKASRFCCASVLMAVDLPALLRPTKAISGNSVAGSWSSWLAVVRNRAPWVQASALCGCGRLGSGVRTGGRGAWFHGPL
jgi:hypothetical protein